MLYSALEALVSAGGGSELSSTLWRGLVVLLTALGFALVFGKAFIAFQKKYRIFERSEKGDSKLLDTLHREKERTPTMGGVIFLGATLFSLALWGDWSNRFLALLVITGTLLALLGFADDFIKLRYAEKRGISARAKFLAQVLIAGGVGLYLYLDPISPAAPHDLFIPFSGGLTVGLGVGFIALCCLVVTSSSNAVNLTDGLDGLAMGCGVIAAAPMAILALVADSSSFSERFSLLHVPGASELTIFLLALIGGGLGFLWFNCHPARVFMGDTGALALGGLLGLVAVLLKQELCFFILGGVFVVEALSVLLQVGSFKLRGKRIFLIAPLHHHFQFKGWAETQVTLRFWLAALFLSVASLASLAVV